MKWGQNRNLKGRFDGLDDNGRSGEIANSLLATRRRSVTLNNMVYSNSRVSISCIVIEFPLKLFQLSPLCDKLTAYATLRVLFSTFIERWINRDILFRPAEIPESSETLSTNIFLFLFVVTLYQSGKWAFSSHFWQACVHDDASWEELPSHPLPSCRP